MNFSETAIAIGISVLIAVGGSAPVANESETGITRTPRTTTEVTRTSRSGSAETVKVRGEAEYTYGNYSTMDFLAFTRIDAESTGTAKMMVSMMDSEYVLDSLDGFDLEGTFRVSGAGVCNGLYGTMDWTPMYLIACADGQYVNLVLATDKELGIDVLQDVYADGAFTVPEGYEEDAA